MPETSVEDEVAAPTSASRDVAKPRTSFKQKLFRRVSGSSLSKSAKLHRQVVSAEVACTSERGCYCTPSESPSVRLISVKRRDPEADFNCSVPVLPTQQQANATSFGRQSSAPVFGDGVSQLVNGRMENGPAAATVTEVPAVSGEAVDGEAKPAGKVGLTGEDGSVEPARAACGQPQESVDMQVEEITPGPLTTHGKFCR